MPAATRSRRRPIVFGALGIVAAAAVTVACVLWIGTARTQNVGVAWPHGKSFLYAFDSHEGGIDASSSLFASSRSGDRTYRLDVTGTVRATVLCTDCDGTIVAWTFDTHRVRLRSDAPISTMLEATLERDLDNTYDERIDAAGRIVALAPPPKTSSLGNGFVRRLTSELTITKPPTVSDFGRTWTTEEPDPDGSRTSTYALAYWLDSPLSVPTARFKRTASLDIPPIDPFVTAPRIVAKSYDQGLVRLDGVVSHEIATQRRAIRVGKRRVAGSIYTLAATLVSIRRIPDVDVPNETLRALARAPNLHDETTSATIREHAFQKIVTSTRFGEVVASMRIAREASYNVAATSRTLTAHFVEHPDTIATIAPLFARARPGTPTFETLELALQAAGTAAAQHLLATTMLARAYEPAAKDLAYTLGFLAAPNAESITALRTLANTNPGCAEDVELALGTAASRLATSDPARSIAIAKDLASRLALASTNDRRHVLLLALGNAGVAQTGASILAYVRDPDPAIRNAAAKALRTMPGDAASLARIALLHDAVDTVRLNAANAFADREPTSQEYAAVETAARHDTSREVRIAAIDALGQAYVYVPAARDVLRDVRDHDADPHVVAAANAGLENIDAIERAERV